MTRMLTWRWATGGIGFVIEAVGCQVSVASAAIRHYIFHSYLGSKYLGHSWISSKNGCMWHKETLGSVAH